MDVIWVLFFCCFSVVFADDGNKKNKIELYPPTPTYAGQTRMPRAFFKKLHSGAAFLTGLKLGAVLSKKGFELGHGKIASTHSFQIFGKPVNTAMSLSYGNTGSLLPVVDDPPQTADDTLIKNQEKKIFHVTVVENVHNETDDGTVQDLNQHLDEKQKVSDDNIVLNEDSVEEEPIVETNSNFLKEHNKIVKEFNEGILRRKV